MSEEKCDVVQYLLYDFEKGELWELKIDFIEQSVMAIVGYGWVEYEYDVDLVSANVGGIFIASKDEIDNVLNGIVFKISRSAVLGEMCRNYVKGEWF